MCVTYNAVFGKSAFTDVSWWDTPARWLLSQNGCLKTKQIGNPEIYTLNDTAVSANMSAVGLDLPDFTFAPLSGNFLSSQVK